MNSRSSVSLAYVVVKLCVIISSFIAAGLLLGSDLWKNRSDLNSTEQAGSNGLSIVTVLGGCVAALLLAAYVYTTMKDSVSTNVLGINLGVGVLWTILSFIFACLFVGVYATKKFIVVTNWPYTEEKDYNGFLPDYKNVTIFDSDFPDNGDYIAAAVLGFIAAVSWFVDTVMTKVYRDDAVSSKPMA
eukprot:Clim_evm3s174 gene=Clim_evmTU3s174